MNPLLKQIIAVFISVFILFMIIYGSYLPYRKSQSFILAMRTLQSGKINTLEDFFNIVSNPLEMKSPIGQEEIVRQFITYFSGLISQNNNVEITKLLMDYIKKYYEPIVERGKGLSFNQQLYLTGMLNLNAYTQTGDEKYLKDARKYFEFSYNLGPKRPQAIYGLLNVCKLEKNKECIKDLAEKILTYWPEDKDIQKILEEVK